MPTSGSSTILNAQPPLGEGFTSEQGWAGTAKDHALDSVGMAYREEEDDLASHSKPMTAKNIQPSI